MKNQSKDKLYVGIDLHSNNSVIGIINQEGKKIVIRRLKNTLEEIDFYLQPYKKDIVGIAIESTYNWYWLVDGLMDEGYTVHLGNPAAFKQYKGLKYVDDKSDAFWLAKMLSLNLLPEGYIYPKENRAVRDLLRRRSYLVRLRTSAKLSLQQIYTNQSGLALSNNKIEKLGIEDIAQYFDNNNWQINGEVLLSTIHFLKGQIKKIEKKVLGECKTKDAYRSLKTIPGIGEVLALTISLETGSMDRFNGAGQYASYSRCVPSSHWSNEKKKGEGNSRNGNKYLAWAYSEAANFCIRYCNEAKGFYQRKQSKGCKPKAFRAVSNKLAKACYHLMKEGREFDGRLLFG